MTDLDSWRFTGHALDRALDMALSAGELRAVLDDPDLCYTATDRGRGNSQVWRKGRIALVVDPTMRAVISVLWATTEVYDRDDISRCRDGG